MSYSPSQRPCLHACRKRHTPLHSRRGQLRANGKRVLPDGAYGKEISIGVQDNGPGIPDKEKVFDRFYRASPKNEKGHHGLGLAVAREIASAHKGTLTVTDAAGGGALFLLTLPVK